MKLYMESATHPAASSLADVRAFVETLEGLGRAAQPELRDLFEPSRPITVARAPGRLDVMGGIADYSGSLVLEMPIAQAVLAAVQPSAQGSIRIASMAEDGVYRYMQVPSEELVSGSASSYAAARAYFLRDSATSWAAYVAGSVLVLMREAGLCLDRGLSIFIQSGVPEGKGVSSSAALEVATMQAVAAASGWTLERLDLASWCQIAENHVVGAPCGIMDQMTSACGKQGELLELLCQPARILGNVNVARALGVWGIDSGLRHAVSGADYGQVRVGAFMGYRMIAALAGLPTRILGRGRVTIDDPRWRGYLANLSPSEYGERFASALPDAMWGAEFLAAYGGISDSVTSVEPERLYQVRKPTQHPIHEHVRVRTFAELLRHEARSESERAQLGELMYQSHASYSACGLGSSGTDRLVELVRERGPQLGLYGAKITGGGSGGTVAVLAREDAEATVLDVVRKYAEETGHEPVVFRGSSLGAHEFGSVRLRPA